jgi:adenosylmethionine-8-amino-7-oxononanoate aminotransferase
MPPLTRQLIDIDKRHLWHPFTQMQDWCAPDHEPLVLAGGDGALLRDTEGREYIDGNSSIWTNLHGHNHPKINAAIRNQLDSVAHTSFLGFTNPPAIRLAEELVKIAPEPLSRVFYSDDGSTAIEVAIKMSVQYWQLKGCPERRRFVAFNNAYHGDTLGAASLGGVGIFHDRFESHCFPVDRVTGMEELETPTGDQGAAIQNPDSLAAVVIEPLIQGAAGMRLWPRGMLARLRQWCDAHGVLLILDEVMTGFGRTGTMFACQQENVVPDFLAVAKGITGGYLPLAATLTTENIYEAFLGTYEEQKTFYYGHSYCGNQVACAAALANLSIFREESVLEKLQPKIRLLAELLKPVAGMRHVAEVRQCGFIAGIELMQDGKTPFEARLQTGNRVCIAARRHGLLTRPVRDTVVLMPPYCITEEQLVRAVDAVVAGILEVCG